MQQAITYDTTKRYHIAGPGVLTTCLHYLIISHTATESNRHTTRMKIRRSVVSSTFIFPHPPEDEKKKKTHTDLCPKIGLGVSFDELQSIFDLTDSWMEVCMYVNFLQYIIITL